MSKYTDRLKKMQDTVIEQMEDYVPGGFSLLPEGEYNFRVQAVMDETKKLPVRLQVTWQFTVADGESEGRKLFDRTIIEDNKVGLQICRGRIEDLGFKWPEKIVKLENLLEDISSQPPLVLARITHETSTSNGREFTNARIRIIEVLETTGNVDEQPADDPAEKTPSADEQDPDQAGLLNICGSFGFDQVDDSMTSDEIIAALKKAEMFFPEDQLHPEELEVLERVDADLIERKASKPPVRKMVKAPAKAPVKAPVKKPAAPVKKGGRR